jgi:Uma2 family endonuclease
METVITGKKSKKKPSKIPEYLIYEVVRGKPIYYKGYKDVLNKTKTFEEIIMDSTLQAWLKFRLSLLLGQFFLDNGYEATTGEQGLVISKEEKRGADIAVFKAENFVKDEHYSRQTPELVFEIDVKADTENTTEMDYVLEKVADYHRFGVRKVIWIFTKNRKVMVAEPNQPWLTLDWTAEVGVMKGLTLNLATMAASRKA